MKYLLVIGSRSFRNYTLLEEKLNNEIGSRKDITIVSGGANGADALAKEYAKLKKIKYIEFPAKWKEYGRSAGYRRNEEMHKYISEHEERKVIAFWDGQSRGTQHNFGLADKYKNEIEIIRCY